MKYELAGEGELFSRDPIVPPADQGTKENPILVPSAEHERAVGYEDPDAGQLVWFTLTKGPVHYVPDIDLYFKMFPVGDGSGGHWRAAAALFCRVCLGGGASRTPQG